MHESRRSEEAGTEIETAVIGYLREHPDAADTLDGIVDWWLPRQRYDMARSRIEHALCDLVGRGLLRRRRLPGGVELYSLKDPPLTPRH